MADQLQSPIHPGDFRFDRRWQVYLRKDEPFHPYMNLLTALRHAEDLSGLEFRAELLLALMQVKAHTLLDAFLSGHVVPGRVRWLYPVVSYASNATKRTMADVLFLARLLETRTGVRLPQLRAFAQTFHQEAMVSLPEVATLLSGFYCDLEVVLSSSNIGTKTVVVAPPPIDPTAYQTNDAGYLHPLVEMVTYCQEHLSKYVVGLYLHGSLSTMDYVPGFSDMDTFMILSADTARQPRPLLEVREQTLRSLAYFYRIDPLQHHGHFVVTEQDMWFYPQSFFPFVLFDFSKSIINHGHQLPFQERDSTVERFASFFGACQFLRKYYCTPGKLRLMEFKFLLHTLLMLPTWYLQALGEYTYKKFSFQRVAARFKGRGWRAVEAATQVRTNWRGTKQLSSWVQSVLAMSWNPLALPALCALINRRLPNNLLSAANSLSPSALELAEHMWDDVRERLPS